MDFDFTTETINLDVGTVLTINTVGSITLPASTTANRPTGVTGMLRYNTSLTNIEWYNGTTWVQPSGLPANPTTSVQWNNAGAFGGSAAFLFTTGTNPFVTVLGTTATNQLRVGPAFTAAGAASATVYIETNTTDQDGQLIYFNSGTVNTSGYISYAYDTNTPYLRLTDSDDDPPYITFNTIGLNSTVPGTYALPLYVSAFGARGGYGTRLNGANTGFSWYVGANTSASALITAAAPIMELDTAFLRIPVVATAARAATPANGMLDYNSDEDILEGYAQAYTTTISPVAFQRTELYRKRRTWTDEFMVGSVATTGVALYGELNWSISNTSGTNTVVATTPVADHPGILTLGTAAGVNNNVRIHMGNTAATTIILANQVEYFAFLIRLPSAITNCIMRFGLATDWTTTTTGAAAPGTDAVYFQRDTGVSNNLQFITRAAGTSSAAVNVVTTLALNTWYFCEAFYNGTNWTPVVNGTVGTAQTANIPTGAVSVGLTLANTAANGATHTLDLDLFSMYTRELGIRY